METVEHRLGVTLGGLSAFLVRYDYDDGEVSNVIYTYGELYAEIDSDPMLYLLVYIEAYDQTGRLVTKDHVQFRADEFFGFDTFDAELHVPVERINRIRIYPDIEDGRYKGTYPK